MQEGDKSIADKGVLPELVQVMTVAPEGTPDPQMVEFAIRSGLCYTLYRQRSTLDSKSRTANATLSESKRRRRLGQGLFS